VTESNLEEALAGESKARVRYLVFGDKADKLRDAIDGESYEVEEMYPARMAGGSCGVTRGTGARRDRGDSELAIPLRVGTLHPFSNLDTRSVE
jgi:hypothetical protein